MRTASLALALGAAALARPRTPSRTSAGAPRPFRSRPLGTLRPGARRPLHDTPPRAGRDPPGGDPPAEPPPAHVRRGERRGLLERRREADHLPAPNAAEGLSCDQQFVMDVDGPAGAADGLERRRGAPPAATSTTATAASSSPPRTSPTPPARRRPTISKGYVWPMLDGYDIYTSRPDGSRLRRLTEHAGLRRRGHPLAGRQDDRLHLGAGRRPRDLHDDDRRHEREAPHARAGLRRRPVLLPRRQAHRVPRATPTPTRPASPATRRCSPSTWYRPRDLEIWVMNADGTNKHQVTKLGAASFAPVLPPGRPAHHLLDATTRTRAAGTSTSG